MSAAAVATQRRRRRHRRSEWLTVLARAARTTRGRIGLVLAGIVILIAIIGPLLAPDDPNALLGVPYASASGEHLLGTDGLGRDVLSRLLSGGATLLAMAALATVIGVAIGAFAGVTAAYKRGLWDEALMRPVDVLLAFPPVVLALVLLSVLGPKLWLIVVAIALGHAPQVARVIRSATLDVAERDFVRSAELSGLSDRRIITRELLPNLTSPLMVELGLRLTYSIVLIAGLSFLGLGQQPPASNWGLMMNENRPGLQVNPFGILAPAALVAVLTIGTNLLTDAVARVSGGSLRRVGGSFEPLPPGAQPQELVEAPAEERP